MLLVGLVGASDCVTYSEPGGLGSYKDASLYLRVDELLSRKARRAVGDHTKEQSRSLAEAVSLIDSVRASRLSSSYSNEPQFNDRSYS
ncbi:MAG: hypothetical protein ACI9QQ_000640 [Myxococcota bacterium]|jgi:hypothetical protein